MGHFLKQIPKHGSHFQQKKKKKKKKKILKHGPIAPKNLKKKKLQIFFKNNL